MVPEWKEDKYIAVVIGTIVLCGATILGITANLFALNFFWKSVRTTVLSQIFCVVTLTDLLTSILTVFVGLCYVQDRRPGLFSDVIFRETWGSLWNFSSRYSVYLVAVLSITRSVSIIFPFTGIKVRAVQASIVAYAAWLFCSTPAFHGITHYYEPGWCALGLNKSEFILSGSRGVKYYMIVMSIPVLLLLPVLLTTISALASLYRIIIHSRGGKPTELSYLATRIAAKEPVIVGGKKRLNVVSPFLPRNENNRKDNSLEFGVTIVLITVVCIVLNLPYSTIYLYVQTRSNHLSVPVNDVIKSPYINSYVIAVTNILSISLNAALNPLLYYLRMKLFRDHVHSLLLRPKKSTPWIRGKGALVTVGQAAQANVVIFNRNSCNRDLLSLHLSDGSSPLVVMEDMKTFDEVDELRVGAEEYPESIVADSIVAETICSDSPIADSIIHADSIVEETIFSNYPIADSIIADTTIPNSLNVDSAIPDAIITDSINTVTKWINQIPK